MAVQQNNAGSSNSIPHLIPGFLNRFAQAPKNLQPQTQPTPKDKTRTQTVPSVAAMRRCRHGGELGYD